jgi:hypothetical protein
MITRLGESPTHFRRCGLCGRRFDRPEGQVDDPNFGIVDLCHPFDSDTPMTCYYKWTVYGVRRLPVFKASEL